MRYANIQRAFSLILRILSLNSYARYYRSFKYCNKVLPVYLIHRCIIPTLYFHELVTLYEGLLMKVVGIALIVTSHEGSRHCAHSVSCEPCDGL